MDPTTKHVGFWPEEDKEKLRLKLELQAREYAQKGLMTAAEMREAHEEGDPKFKEIDSRPYDGIFALYESIIESRGYKPSTSCLKPGNTSEEDEEPEPVNPVITSDD